MRDEIVFYLNGRRRAVSGERAFLSLSDYLRLDQGLTGTKVVCAEGDCGSCTVLLGRPAGPKAAPGAGGAADLDYRAVCSCIVYLFQLDACHVLSVEGLGDEKHLDPIRAAIVAANGTQCGFCTPGIVMALTALFEACPDPGEDDLRRGLSGNLCRCTGYESILEAGRRVDRAAYVPLNRRFADAAMAAELAALAAEPFRLRAGERLAAKPTDLAGLFALRAEFPRARLVAGGTDLGVLANKGKLAYDQVVSLAALPELRGVAAAAGLAGPELAVGAGETIAELEDALRRAAPAFGGLLGYFGSPQIRNAGTVGGNLGNASPIGDASPGLLALDARLLAAGPAGRRELPLAAYYTGYRRTSLAPDEIVAGLRIPLPGPNERLWCRKVSRRRDLDISTVSAAVWLRLEGGVVADCRVAFGGVAASPLRLPEAEAALRGRALAPAAFAAAAAAAKAAVQPLSDVRASAAYRLALVGGLLETCGDELCAAPAGPSGPAAPAAGGKE